MGLLHLGTIRDAKQITAPVMHPPCCLNVSNNIWKPNTKRTSDLIITNMNKSNIGPSVTQVPATAPGAARREA